MYYSKLANYGAGLTNQLISFINSIIIAYNRNDKIVLVDQFLNDFWKTNLTPISQVIKIDKLNEFLKKYDIILIDKINANLQIISVEYGVKNKTIDITNEIGNFYKNKYLTINQSVNFNQIKGDPLPGVKKKLFITYQNNDYTNTQIFDEYLTENIIMKIDKIISVKYGIHDNFIDLTSNFSNNSLFIDRNTILNNIKGDPLPNIKKNLYITYKINDNVITETYDEILPHNISLNLESENINKIFYWIDSINKNMFEEILFNLDFCDDFKEKANILFKNINENQKINVIHLKIEVDSIRHYAKQNKMTEENLLFIAENKFIDLIKQYIDKKDLTILLSGSLTNRVVDFLKDNNYNYKFSEKFYDDREFNAIVDLLISKRGNNTFILNFNIKTLSGSTFSYYIEKMITKYKNKIFIDMDFINNPPDIYIK